MQLLVMNGEMVTETAGLVIFALKNVACSNNLIEYDNLTSS
jgi:hypothetical protein